MIGVGFKRIWEKIVICSAVLIRGLCRALYGSAIIGLIILSVYGFIEIPNESGWAVVADFLGSCATLIVALGNMYLMGCKKRVTRHGRVKDL